MAAPAVGGGGKEEMKVSIKEYIPPCILKEKAIQMAIQDSELVELSQWKGLGL
jgi:hypothetical protein